VAAVAHGRKGGRLPSRLNNKAVIVFAIGLLGASLLAAAVLPLTTAYAVCESFGFERGVSFSFRMATFAEEASVVLHSAEYESDVVGSYYRQFLGRPASPPEVAAWVSLVQGGSPAERVAGDFVASPAYGALPLSLIQL